MICKRCQYRRCIPTEKDGAHAVFWQCGKEGKKIEFGYQFQYDAGKNMPKKCIDFNEQTWDKNL